jgi:hypothetical protein
LRVASSRIISVALLAAGLFAHVGALAQSRLERIEVSSGQARAIEVASRSYRSWKHSSEQFYCVITDEGANYLVLIRPYSIEEFQRSVLFPTGQELRAGLSIAYQIDKKDFRVVSETLQR